MVAATQFPNYYEYNALRVEGSDPGVRAAELMAIADELQEGLEHRRVDVDDPDAGERLRPDFAAAGWRTYRLVAMRWSAPVPADTLELDEVEAGDVAGLRFEWALNDGWDVTEERARKFIAVESAAMALRGSRWFAYRGPSGEPVAFVALVTHDDQAEVALAYCTPDHRGGGIGTRLVLSAVRAAAGCGTVWIIADDEDRPKHLYQRLGFEPAAVQHEFTRLPL